MKSNSSGAPAWVGAFLLALNLMAVSASAQGVTQPTLWIDDLAEGPPVIKFAPTGTFATAPILPPGDIISTPDGESFIANLVGVPVAPNFTPVSVILDEPGHTATSDELAVNVVQPAAGGPSMYQITWFSDVTEGGLGFNPSPNNPVETGSFQRLYQDPQLQVLTRSDVEVVPEPTTIITGALLLLPFGASTLRILRKGRKA